jgi:hypothetical protein
MIPQAAATTTTNSTTTTENQTLPVSCHPHPAPAGSRLLEPAIFLA